MKKLAHSASFHSTENIAPSKAGIKQLTHRHASASPQCGLSDSQAQLRNPQRLTWSEGPEFGELPKSPAATSFLGPCCSARRRRSTENALRSCRLLPRPD